MRYLSGNRNRGIFIFLAVIIVLTAFTTINKRKNIVGIWQYTGIYKNDSSIAIISPNDSMVLNQNGSFRYDIASLNKHSVGNWVYFKKKGKQYPAGLKLTYAPDNKIRTFYFCYLNATEMCIFEGNVQFKYKRRR